MSRERYTITVEPLPARPGEPEPAIRLRQWLKLALRAFKLRCVDVKQSKPSESDTVSDATEGRGK